MHQAEGDNTNQCTRFLLQTGPQRGKTGIFLGLIARLRRLIHDKLDSEYEEEFDSEYEDDEDMEEAGEMENVDNDWCDASNWKY